MDILSIIAIVSLVVGIAASIVQVYEFFQKKNNSGDNPEAASPPENKLQDLPAKSEPPVQRPPRIGRSKIQRWLVQSEEIAREACERFEATTIFPQDCKDVARQIRILWDEHLFALFEELNSAEKIDRRYQRLQLESRALAPQIFKEIKLLEEELRKFEDHCLDENDAIVAIQRQKIHKELSELYLQIRGMRT